MYIPLLFQILLSLLFKNTFFVKSFQHIWKTPSESMEVKQLQACNWIFLVISLLYSRTELSDSRESFRKKNLLWKVSAGESETTAGYVETTDKTTDFWSRPSLFTLKLLALKNCFFPHKKYFPIYFLTFVYLYSMQLFRGP